MCQHCGCRDSRLIGQFTAEHAAIDRVAGGLQRAVVGGRHAYALQLIDELVKLLTPHVHTAECLVAQLSERDRLSASAARLRADHNDVRAIFSGMDRTSPDWPATLLALDRLRGRIYTQESALLSELVATGGHV